MVTVQPGVAHGRLAWLSDVNSASAAAATALCVHPQPRLPALGWPRHSPGCPHVAPQARLPGTVFTAAQGWLPACLRGSRLPVPASQVLAEYMRLLGQRLLSGKPTRFTTLL